MIHTVAWILLPYLLPETSWVAIQLDEDQMAGFTDKAIAALRPRSQRYEKWDGGGFGIRISPSGAKSWTWVYHFESRSRRLTLGTYPGVGLADARLKLAEARKLLQQGIDPGSRQVEARRAERSAESLAEVAEAYLEKWARPRKRSAAEDERILRKDVLPSWGRRKANDISRRDVIGLLDRIVDRGSPIAANRTLAIVRRMFGWALSSDIILAHPCTGVKAPGKETRRDRVLKADEIAAFWRALDDPELPIAKPIRLALKLQLTTAQRKGEIIKAEWPEFDLNNRVWTITADKAKNALPHRVPLSRLALTLLEEILAIAPGHTGPWLFPSRRKNAPVTAGAVDTVMRKHGNALGTGDATPHDLRRTAASHMTSIGVSRVVVAKVLNHAEPSVTAVYDRHSYDREKRAALDEWGARLAEIVSSPAPATNIARLRAIG